MFYKKNLVKLWLISTIIFFFVCVGLHTHSFNLQVVNATPTTTVGLNDIDDGLPKDGWVETQGNGYESSFGAGYMPDGYKEVTNVGTDHNMRYFFCVAPNETMVDFTSPFVGTAYGDYGRSTHSLGYALLTDPDANSSETDHNATETGEKLSMGDGIIEQAQIIKTYVNLQIGAAKAVGIVKNNPSLEFEEVISFSKTTPNALSQQLYVKNLSSQTQDYRIVDGQALSSRHLYQGRLGDYGSTKGGGYSQDIMSLGDNKGIYFNSKVDPLDQTFTDMDNGRISILFPKDSDTEKKALNNDLLDQAGPDHYLISDTSYGTKWFSYDTSDVKLNSQKFIGQNVNNAQGLEAINPTKDELLYKGTKRYWSANTDTPGMSLIWNKTALSSGQTARYAFDLFPQKEGKKLVTTQSFQELESDDGGTKKFHVTINLLNQGSGTTSDFILSGFTDTLSKGKLIPNSVYYTDDDGIRKSLNYVYGNYVYTLDGRDKLLNQRLNVGEQSYLEFDILVDKSTSDQTINNTFTLIDDKKANISPSSANAFTVKGSPYLDKLTQTAQLVPQSGTTGTPTNSTDGLDFNPNDKAQFTFDYEINANNVAKLGSQIKFSDVLPGKTKYLPGTLHAVLKNSATDSNPTTMNPTGNLSQITLNNPNGTNYSNGQIIEITFEAQLNMADKDNDVAMNNQATISGNTDDGESISTKSNNFSLNRPQPSTYFVTLPELLSFGNPLNAINHPLTNATSISGNLKVNRYAKEVAGYNVNVAFDNKMSLDHDLIHLLDWNHQQYSSLLGFKENSPTVTTYQDVIPQGVPIKAGGFSDEQVGTPFEADLTGAINGINQWQLRPSGVPKANTYSGDLTWSMTNSLQ